VSNIERDLLRQAATALRRSGSEADYKAELTKIRGQFEKMRQPGPVKIAPKTGAGAETPEQRYLRLQKMAGGG
jgi:hypothetical protein